MSSKRLIAVAGVLALFSAQVVSAQVPQVLGVWELDLQRSNLPASLFPMGIKSEVRSYVQRNDGYLVVLALRINGNGSPDFIQVAAKSDGKDYPQYQSAPLAEYQIHGNPTRITYSERMTSSDTAEVIAKTDGQTGSKATRKVSSDGKTMTLNVTAILADGKEIPFVLVFKKKE